MSVVEVAVVNQCSVLTDNQVSKIVPALQFQVIEHLAPVWRLDAQLSFIGKGTTIPPHAWRLLMLDTTDDQAGDTGYHGRLARRPAFTRAGPPSILQL